MLIPVQIDNSIQKCDVEVQELTFKSIGLKEGDIEDFIRKNIEILTEDESLLVVGQQVRNVENGRSDLVAIDDSGNLVLIEIKRDVDDSNSRKEPFEFQGIRYAANFAKIETVDELVKKVFIPYIENHKNEFKFNGLTYQEIASRLIKDFLENHEVDPKFFNKKQRIFLIASDFDPQMLSACAWLINHKVDISCFKLSPIKIDSQYFLSVEQVLPLRELDNFYVDVASGKTSTGRVANKKINRTYLPRMDKLFEWGIVRPGDILRIKKYDNSEAKVVDHKSVEYKGERLSYNKWGQKVTNWSSICIYEWAFSERLQKLLDEARREKLAETE